MEMIDPGSVAASKLTVQPRSAMAYSAKILRMGVAYRGLSSILYCVKGRYEYSWNGGRASICPGEFVYLPKGGNYSYEIEPDERFVCQIEFDTFYQGNECVFSDHPVLFEGEPGMTEFVTSLTACRDEFAMVSGIFRLLGMMLGELRSGGASISMRRISPAVGYIDTHYTEQIRSDELAARCFLSESQMRRLFLSELGTTPSAYRTRVRIDNAKKLLAGSFESIATVAAAVGYDSQFAFSKAFRKQTGMSPAEFAASVRR